MPPDQRFRANAPVLPGCFIGESSGHPMKNITCIEDLRQLARRKVPRAFFDYADSGSYNEETLRANRSDMETIKLRQRVMVDVSSRSLATTIVGQKVASPFVSGAGRPVGHAARRRRDPGGARGQRCRHSVHALDHVDLFGRRRGGGDQQTVLVPALCDQGPRLLKRPPGARGGGEGQCAGTHCRSAGARPAPPRHQERHDRAAEIRIRTSSTSRSSRPGRSASCGASARPSAISPAM